MTIFPKTCWVRHDQLHPVPYCLCLIINRPISPFTHLLKYQSTCLRKQCPRKMQTKWHSSHDPSSPYRRTIRLDYVCECNHNSPARTRSRTTTSAGYKNEFVSLSFVNLPKIRKHSRWVIKFLMGISHFLLLLLLRPLSSFIACLPTPKRELLLQERRVRMWKKLFDAVLSIDTLSCPVCFALCRSFVPLPLDEGVRGGGGVTGRLLYTE